MIELEGKKYYGIGTYKVKKKESDNDDCVRYFIKTNDNRFKRGFTSKVEAIAFLEGLKKGNITLPPTKSKLSIEEVSGGITVEEAISRYIKDREIKYKSGEIEYGTLSKLKHYFKVVIKPNINTKKKIKDLCNKDLYDFKMKLGYSIYKQVKGKDGLPELYSTKTKNDILQIYKEFIIYSMKYLGANHVNTEDYGKFKETDAEAAKRRDKKSKIWTTNEYCAFLNELERLYGKYSPTYGIYLILGNKGTRLGECLAIKCKAVDEIVKTGYLDVVESVTRKVENGGFKIKNTKNNDERSVPIGKEITDYLVEYINKQKLHVDYDDEWLLFHREGDGYKPMAERTLNNHKDTALKNLNLRWNTNHELRHMFNNVMDSKNISAAERGRIIGNSENVNSKVYTHGNETTNGKVLEIEGALAAMTLNKDKMSAESNNDTSIQKTNEKLDDEDDKCITNVSRNI